MNPLSERSTLLGGSWLDRRRFLSEAATGLGSIALASLLSQDNVLKARGPASETARANAPRPPHFPAKAKNVIVIFCTGGVSQLDSWDYKPELFKHDGQILKSAPQTTFQGPAGPLAKPRYPFRPHGETGKMISDMVPYLAEHADGCAFIHSLTSESNTHGTAMNFLSTGQLREGFPSAGSWVTYGLGSENANLPAYVAIPDPRGLPPNGANNWGNGFLPASSQGITFSSTEPVRHLKPYDVPKSRNQAARELLRRMNRHQINEQPGERAFAARVASYELAARMQLSIPDVTNLNSEPQHVLKLYGADDPANPDKVNFARNCILARRLIEKGVRFVELFNGAYASGGALNWDGHHKLKEQYDVHAEILDQPAAGLIHDLKQRGLLEETVVVWCTEFGRMPMFQKGAHGRDHNPNGFTAWLTGAGVKSGVSHGVTDDFGLKAVQDVQTLYDLNATLLHLLGLDHKRLTFLYNGLERRLTDTEGYVIPEVLA